MKATLSAFLLLLATLANAQTIEVGGGVLMNDEDAIDVSDARAFVSLTGMSIPVPGDTYTGVTVEAGYSTAMLWSLWSTNRTEIARVIAGADVQIARGGPELGSSFDVDMRLVAGYRVSEHIGVYAYMLESGTPFQFAVGWKF
jgi:hypothetical protein